jgi:HlyD family secretion protein
MHVTRTRLAAAAAGIAALALLAWSFTPRPVAVETAAATAGRFEQGIEEDGRTRLKERYTVSAPVAARLLRITLKEGDSVRAGDPVAALVPAMPSLVDDRSAREAQARVQAAGANLVAARARVDRAAVAVEEATLELRRTERLAAEGFLAPARLDSARLAAAAAQRELQGARAAQDVAAHDREQAAAALLPPGSGAQAGRPLVLRAPVDGVVLKVAQASEATLPAGTPLVDIGDPRRLEIVAELLTTDAVQARPGARAVVERWGGPPLAAVVSRVEPGAFTKVSALGVEEQRVKVLLDVQDPPPAWSVMGDGFRVTVRVITQAVEQAVLVPAGALFPVGDGGMGVYRIDGGRARLQVVDVGGRNGREAWARDGLQPGQVVIVYPPPTVEDGKRVQVRGR